MASRAAPAHASSQKCAGVALKPRAARSLLLNVRKERAPTLEDLHAALCEIKGALGIDARVEAGGALMRLQARALRAELGKLLDRGRGLPPLDPAFLAACAAILGRKPVRAELVDMFGQNLAVWRRTYVVRPMDWPRRRAEPPPVVDARHSNARISHLIGKGGSMLATIARRAKVAYVRLVTEDVAGRGRLVVAHVYAACATHEEARRRIEHAVELINKHSGEFSGDPEELAKQKRMLTLWGLKLTEQGPVLRVREEELMVMT